MTADDWMLVSLQQEIYYGSQRLTSVGIVPLEFIRA